jgi:hypothetical protein
MNGPSAGGTLSGPVGIRPHAGTVTTESLPSVGRHVPHHALAMLDGCTQDDMNEVLRSVGDAIDVGAPLYNKGNVAGCYHMYEGAAVDLERQLPVACSGPITALRSGRTRAATAASPALSAWAMRDTFDGLVDVIERREKLKP